MRWRFRSIKTVTVSKWPEFETTSYFSKSLKNLTVKNVRKKHLGRNIPV